MEAYCIWCNTAESVHPIACDPRKVTSRKYYDPIRPKPMELEYAVEVVDTNSPTRKIEERIKAGWTPIRETAFHTTSTAAIARILVIFEREKK